MAIHPEHLEHLGRFDEYYQAPMLMLGMTEMNVPGLTTAAAYFSQWVGSEYSELDLDGGDLMLDLNEDLPDLSEGYSTVLNFGTIEHVWNAHNAWVNALRAVRVGGHFLNHSPITGYRDHGLHLTSAPAIRAFVSKNGFYIVKQWVTVKDVGKVLWFVAVKKKHIKKLSGFEPAWQIYEEGQKKTVR